MSAQEQDSRQITADRAKADADAVELRALRMRVSDLGAALQMIAAPTYGTELTSTDEERANHYWRQLERMQRIARDALKSER